MGTRSQPNEPVAMASISPLPHGTHRRPVIHRCAMQGPGCPLAGHSSPMRSLLACVLAVLLVAGGHAPGGTGAWTWPVEGPRVVLRPFLAPPTPYGAGHRGADLAATASGVPVRAATSGVVHFAGVVVDRGRHFCSRRESFPAPKLQANN